MEVLPGSPAVDHGITVGAPATDQRGLPRPVNGPIDIGAFQHQPTAKLAIIPTDNPPSITAGGFIVLTVQAEDAFGDSTPSSDSLLFTSTDPQAIFPVSPALENGRGTFFVTLETSGTQTVFIADQTEPAVAGTSFSISVSPLQATHLAITGVPNEAEPGQAGSLTVFAEDPFGNVDPSDNSTTVSFTSSDPNAILPAPLTLTNGMVSFNATFQTVGTQTLTATQDNIAVGEAGIPSSATLTAVGIQTASVSSTIYQPSNSGSLTNPPVPIAAVYSGNPTPVPINGVNFLDYKVQNATSGDVAIVVFSFTAGLTNPTLAFFDSNTNTWEPVAGSTIVPNSYRVNTTNNTITVIFDSSSFPTITELTGTVFTVAIPATNNTPSSTVGVFPPVVSTENSGTAVQTTFVSSSSLSLTLTPLQQGTITTSQSTNTGGGDGDGSSDPNIQALWDYFNDWWRSMLISLEQLPSGNDVGAGAKPAGTGDKVPGTGGGAAGAGNKPAGTGGATGPQSRNHAARDAFFAMVQPDAVVPELLPRFSAPMTAPMPVTEPPPVITEDEGYGAAALLGLPGLGLMLEDIHQRRARQRWRGSEPACKPC